MLEIDVREKPGVHPGQEATQYGGSEDDSNQYLPNQRGLFQRAKQLACGPGSEKKNDQLNEEYKKIMLNKDMHGSI
jgi:hypothetical protein